MYYTDERWARCAQVASMSCLWIDEVTSIALITCPACAQPTPPPNARGARVNCQHCNGVIERISPAEQVTCNRCRTTFDTHEVWKARVEASPCSPIVCWTCTTSERSQYWGGARVILTVDITGHVIDRQVTCPIIFAICTYNTEDEMLADQAANRRVSCQPIVPGEHCYRLAK